MILTRTYTFILILMSICLSSCSQDDGLAPGYKWELFKNTPNWDLAKAVKQEDTAAIFEIVKQKEIDINLQEPKLGRSLLMLAVGNDKFNSTQALLKAGADLNLRDSSGDQAIHEAVRFISLRKNSYIILKLLLENHADANSYSENGTYTTPLVGGVTDFPCFKLLMSYGADPYFQYSDHGFAVWIKMFIDERKDGIFAAKDLILERKMPIPNPIARSLDGRTSLDIFYFLNFEKFEEHSEKQKIKVEILNYLKEINFPADKVYIKK
jgi:ankyrin repeat protein